MNLSRRRTINIAGVDEFKGGWLAIVQSSQIRFRFLGRFEDIFTEFHGIDMVCVDMIIGLPDNGNERDCDKQARRLLGRPRGSSVFPAPIRRVLDCSSYPEANGLSKSLAGKGISKQTFSILPSIKEVDQVVRKRGQQFIREVHPELGFMAMNSGEAMRHSKKSSEGMAERRKLLAHHLGEEFVLEAESAFCQIRPRPTDDLYDAMAALWSTQRLVEGRASTVPGVPTLDSKGLRMEMSY